VFKRRLAGYRRAYARHGRALADEDVVLCDSTFEGGLMAFQTAWRAGRRPSAVAAMSDIIALGALQAARRTGLEVPRDLEIIGFDDIAAASWSHPTLSTVHQPSGRKGARAAQLLVGALSGAAPPAEQIVLPTHLVLRDSTRVSAPPAATQAAPSVA
jgi:LacI family xylobiose transport system transcriptional regulator